MPSVGFLLVTLLMAGNASLKDKGRVVKSVLSRVRSRFIASCSEVDLQDSHDEARLGFSVCGPDARILRTVLTRILEFIETNADAEFSDYDIFSPLVPDELLTGPDEENIFNASCLDRSLQNDLSGIKSVAAPAIYDVSGVDGARAEDRVDGGDDPDGDGDGENPSPKFHDVRIRGKLYRITEEACESPFAPGGPPLIRLNPQLIEEPEGVDLDGGDADGDDEDDDEFPDPNAEFYEFLISGELYKLTEEMCKSLFAKDSPAAINLDPKSIMEFQVGELDARGMSAQRFRYPNDELDELRKLGKLYKLTDEMRESMFTPGQPPYIRLDPKIYVELQGGDYDVEDEFDDDEPTEPGVLKFKPGPRNKRRK